ncbi:MAG: hypothetical protein NTW38_09340 [Candidatus Aminicenantes bacterium]|nr:hypothetical protein [Candidatus Aminicenantes bacterium]
MKNAAVVIAVLIIVVAFSAWSCAPGSNAAEKTPDSKGKVAGFWFGLWHGLISPVTFVISLFSNTVRLYEVHNNGGWYNLGFVLGAGLFLGGGIFGHKKKRSDR